MAGSGNFGRVRRFDSSQLVIRARIILNASRASAAEGLSAGSSGVISFTSGRRKSAPARLWERELVSPRTHKGSSQTHLLTLTIKLKYVFPST